ncbi:hypothetical protein HMSSN036_48940 [Paenibacillus macerans]|nr:hypothetical protein HMSSN036_48940 [Paenibacillus macerans]
MSLGIGNRIKQLRKNFHSNQSQFAALLGISQGTLSDLENDKYNPSLETIVSINKKFGIDYNWILGNLSGEGYTNNELEAFEERIISKLIEFMTKEALHLSNETGRSITYTEVSLLLRHYFSSISSSVEVNPDELIWLTKYRSLTARDKKEIQAITDLKYVMN